MCEKLYEIHILERTNHCPKFYVIDRRTGERFANWHWPPELKRLGCDYINEHSEFIVDYGYEPEYVKCYFVDTRNIFGYLNIFVELTEEGERREMADYQNRILQISIGADTTGNSVCPTFYHPKKKE